MLAATCIGFIAFSVARVYERDIDKSSAARAARAQERARFDDARASLDAVAARIEATSRAAGELPETLGEAPPKDPWGRPVEYARSAPEHATLRSAGPDGKFGTKDDVRRELELK